MCNAARIGFFAARLGLLAVVTGMTALLSSCGGFFVYPGSTSTTTASTTSSVVYVANATTSTVAGYALASGSLTAVTGSPYALPIAPTALVVTPSNSFLYVGSLGAVYGYSIGSTGQLTALNSGSALASAEVASMDVSTDGNWLFLLDAGGVTVDEYAINTSTGSLTAATGASFSVSGGVSLPRMIRVAPNNEYVIAAMGTGGDVVFSFNTSTGALAQTQILAGSSTSSDNGLAIDANSAYVYIARSGTGSGVAAYSIGTNGALSSVAGSPFTAGNGPYSVVLRSSGSYLYAANRTDGTISGYSVASGVLTPLSTSPYASGSLVTSLGRDNSGDYIVAASFGGSPDLTMYSFDATNAGKLDDLSSTVTGTDPTGATAVALTH